MNQTMLWAVLWRNYLHLWLRTISPTQFTSTKSSQHRLSEPQRLKRPVTSKGAVSLFEQHSHVYYCQCFCCQEKILQTVRLSLFFPSQSPESVPFTLRTIALSCFRGQWECDGDCVCVCCVQMNACQSQMLRKTVLEEKKKTSHVGLCLFVTAATWWILCAVFWMYSHLWGLSV